VGTNRPPSRIAPERFRSWARRAPSLLRRLSDELILFLYPPTCAVCGEPVSPAEPLGFCPCCRDSLELVEGPSCSTCGLPLSPEAPAPYQCGACLGGLYRFDRARAAGPYRGLLREVIHRFKYQGHISLARPLAQLVLPPARELCTLHEIHVVVPVPLHRRRLRDRGFNQAALLARRLGASLDLPVRYTVLSRRRWTEPQIGLSPSQRAKNVRGAFVVSEAAVLRDQGVLLVDDVFTTGETVDQCIRELKRAGAGEVAVLTVARTVAL
jgi:ComF family protein